MGQQQQTTTTMTTMPPLQLQNAGDWGQRVQVVQNTVQPLQNPAYLQPIYSQQVMMPGGQQVLIPGLGQQPQIQVITAGKTFQGNQITPQMLANAQGKSVIGNGGQGFGGTYTLPTSQSQTILFSPVSVLGSQPQQQQQNLMPMTSATTQNAVAKATPQELSKTYTTAPQKVTTVQKNAAGQQIATQQNAQQNQQCVQVSMPTATSYQVCKIFKNAF